MLSNFRSYRLAVEFHQDCNRIKISNPMREQLQRAALSIVLNLAEGSAKPSAKDRARFYGISLGSFREAQAVLSLAGQHQLLIKHDRLGGCLWRLSHPTQT